MGSIYVIIIIIKKYIKNKTFNLPKSNLNRTRSTAVVIVTLENTSKSFV
jgi:hypothetical protein